MGRFLEVGFATLRALRVVSARAPEGALLVTPLRAAAAIVPSVVKCNLSGVGGVGAPRGFAADAASVAPSGETGATKKRRAWVAPGSGDQGEASKDIQRDLVKKYLSQACMSAFEVHELKLKQITVNYQRHELDTGSSEVQVARLSDKITYLIEHSNQHRKDNATKRSLEAMLNTRRRLLRYLRRTDGERYFDLISKLRLRDNVAYSAKDKYKMRK